MLSKLAYTSALVANAASAFTVTEPVLRGPWSESTSMVHLDEAPDVEISIALPTQNMDALAKLVESVSTPGSRNYGAYLSGEQVRHLVAPSDESAAAVIAWLNTHGVTAKPSPSGLNVVFKCSPSKVEEIFDTTVRTVRNVETGVNKLRARTYVVPDELNKHVKAVYGLHGLPLPPRKAFAMQEPAKVNPQTILEKYHVSRVAVSRSEQNRQAVAEFQGENALQSDLDKFFKNQVNETLYMKGDEKIYKVIGENGLNAGVEASLDIQYIMGVAPGIRTEFWGFQGYDFCKDMNDFTTQILASNDNPNVFSISYGYQGDLDSIGCSRQDVTAVNDNLMAIASMGISILVSSGDAGSSLTSDGKLFPSWPASSPYVTAVGGTRFVDQNSTAAEMATDQFGSGGGFSYDFDRSQATWQESDVDNYFVSVKNKPPASYYTKTGRGTPDVSGIAEGYAVYSAGLLQLVGGTSASAPMFAGLVSLLNEARAAVHKPPLGLLNPFLYKNHGCFTDVTEGTGAITRSGDHMSYGWDTALGWDAATGLGTPLFDKLLEAALKL